MNLLSLADRTTRSSSESESSDEPAWRYLDGPASESEEEEEEGEEEEEEPESEPESELEELELDSESESELSPPQNLDACVGWMTENVCQRVADGRAGTIRRMNKG